MVTLEGWLAIDRRPMSFQPQHYGSTAVFSESVRAVTNHPELIERFRFGHRLDGDIAMICRSRSKDANHDRCLFGSRASADIRRLESDVTNGVVSSCFGLLNQLGQRFSPSSIHQGVIASHLATKKLAKGGKEVFEIVARNHRFCTQEHRVGTGRARREEHLGLSLKG